MCDEGKERGDSLSVFLEVEHDGNVSFGCELGKFDGCLGVSSVVGNEVGIQKRSRMKTRTENPSKWRKATSESHSSFTISSPITPEDE